MCINVIEEHFRQVEEWNAYGIDAFNITEPYSSNVDDRTFHELYLFPWYDAVHSGMVSERAFAISNPVLY